MVYKADKWLRREETCTNAQQSVRRGSDALFWQLWALHTHDAQIGKHHTHKTNKKYNL